MSQQHSSFPLSNDEKNILYALIALDNRHKAPATSQQIEDIIIQARKSEHTLPGLTIKAAGLALGFAFRCAYQEREQIEEGLISLFQNLRKPLEKLKKQGYLEASMDSDMPVVRYAITQNGKNAIREASYSNPPPVWSNSL
ncbi:MAG: hypothetical protein R3D66_00875 [Alphaproteobacteria bacterium]